MAEDTFDTPSTMELVQLFEGAMNVEEQIDQLKAEQKAKKAIIEQDFKKFAQAKHCKKSDVTDAFKYYKKRQNATSETDDSSPFFTMCALIDEAAEADEAKIAAQEAAKGR